jgi:hypothetical protein
LYFSCVPKIFLTKISFFFSFVKLVSFTGFILSVIGLTILFLGLSPIVKYSFTTHSIVNHPNYITYLYTVSILSTLYYYLNYKNIFDFSQKAFYLFILLIQIIAQLLSYSRGGYIGTILGSGILITYYYRKKVILIYPLLFAILVLFVPYFFKAKGSISFFSRFYLLIPAYYMITEDMNRLLWGYGAYTNMAVYEKYMVIYGVTEEGISDPHNTYLRLVMMFGILFTLVLILYIIRLIYKTVKASIKTRHLKVKLFYGYLLSAIVGLLAMGLFDSGLVATVFFYLAFLMIFSGMLYHILRSNLTLNIE